MGSQLSGGRGRADGDHDPPVPKTTSGDVARATSAGLLAAALVLAGIFLGSRRLKDFDTALVSYAGASVLAAFGLGYRYAMWIRRPPTRLYFYRGWQLFLAPARLRSEERRVGKEGRSRRSPGRGCR